MILKLHLLVLAQGVFSAQQCTLEAMNAKDHSCKSRGRASDSLPDYSSFPTLSGPDDDREIRGLGGHLKHSQEEYDAHPDKFLRTELIFGTPTTPRSKAAIDLGVIDHDRMLKAYPRQVNIRKVSGTWGGDGEHSVDFTKFGFTKFKLPKELFAQMRNVHDALFSVNDYEGKTYVRRQNYEAHVRRMRTKGMKMEIDSLNRQKAAGVKSDGIVGDKIGAFEKNDKNVTDLMNDWASRSMSSINGGVNGGHRVLATMNNPRSMKMFMHFSNYIMSVRSGSNTKKQEAEATKAGKVTTGWHATGDHKKKKFSSKGAASMVHSIGHWTQPSYWKQFRREMFTELNSKRYEVEPLDIFNYPQFVRDFSSGLIDFTNTWVPFQNYQCRPLAILDVRTQMDSFVGSKTRYWGVILAHWLNSFGGYLHYTPVHNWYMFTEADWKDGEAVQFLALGPSHAGVSGESTEHCLNPENVRSSFDLRAIALNVDMDNPKRAIEWLRALRKTDLEPVFESDEEVRQWIDRHWEEVQERYSVDNEPASKAEL